MSGNVGKTVHLAELEHARQFQNPFSTLANSTVNEALNLGDSTPPVGEYPVTKYLMLGRGGLTFTTLSGGSPTPITEKHKVTDATMFDALPFVIAPVGSDLSPIDRAKYRGRVLEVIDGVSYFAYYIKVVEDYAPTVAITVVEMLNGTLVSEVPYVSSATSLNPTPSGLSNVTVNTATGRHISVKTTISTVLSEVVVSNIVAAAELKWGVSDAAVVSEIAFVSGYDKTISNSLGGISATYTEIQSGQVNVFAGAMANLALSSSELPLAFTLSTSLPLPPVV